MVKGKSLLEVASGYSAYGDKKKSKRKGKKRSPRSKPKFAFKAFKKRHATKRIKVRHFKKRISKNAGKAKMRYQQRLAALVKARAARQKHARKHFASKKTYPKRTFRKSRATPKTPSKGGSIWGSISSIFSKKKSAPVRTATIRPRGISHRSKWGQSSVTQSGTMHQTRPKGHTYSVAADKKRTAMKPGKRKTAWGTKYYEYRVNRSDKKPRERY
jgi:hypothetical protein